MVASESCCHIIGPFSAMHAWFSHSGSLQTKSFAVRVSTSGAMTGTSAGADTRTVVQTAAAVAAAAMSTVPAAKASAPGVRQMWFVHDGQKKAWSCVEPLQLSESQTCFSRCDEPRVHYGSVPPPLPCCWSSYGKRWCSRTLCVLLLCVVPAPLLVSLIAARFHPR